MTRFLDRVTEDAPYLVKKLGNLPAEEADRLCEYFISLRPAQSFLDYNNLYVTHFYRLLNRITAENPKFLARLVNHRNWDWALRYLYLETEIYPGPAQQVFEIIARAAAALPAFRQKNIPYALPYFEKACSTNLANTVRFWSLHLDHLEDQLLFAEQKGIPALAKVRHC